MKRIVKSKDKSEKVIVLLIASILATNLSPYAYTTISIFLFSITSLFIIFKGSFSVKNTKLIYLPILFFGSIVITLFYSIELNFSLKGALKSISFFIIPSLFLFLPNFKEKDVTYILSLFSFSMVLYAVFFISQALFYYLIEKDINVFYFHNLVGLDRNAIYVAIFASLAFFYFYNKKEKSAIEIISQYIILLFIFLLSSKTVFLIDVILIIIHYIFFNKTKDSVKFATLFVATLFTLFSLFFIPEIRSRILEEYQTAFVDNTINKDFEKKNQRVYNISLHEAWTKKNFKENDFFPGTAFRVFNVRVFKEINEKECIALYGVGINASDLKIKEIYKRYNVFQKQNYFNFHNQYIQTLSETGIIGLFLLLFMLIFNMVNAIKHKNFMHLVFAFSMIIILATESMFCRQRGIVFFVTLYCIFNSISYTKNTK